MACFVSPQNFLTSFWYYTRIVLTWLWDLILIYGFPITIYYFFNDVIPYIYWTCIGCILLTNFMILTEMIVSVYIQTQQKPYHARRLPVDEEDNRQQIPKHVAVIIAAHLPNEVNTIADPIRHHLAVDLPEGVELDIIVAHNDGHQEQLNQLTGIIASIEAERDDVIVVRNGGNQQQLDQLTTTIASNEAEHDPEKQVRKRLHNMQVLGSKSKAENINFALDQMKQWGTSLADQQRPENDHSVPRSPPEVVALFDADAMPHHTNLKRALHTMTLLDADVVQGRNMVNRGYNFVAIEMDIIYCIYHPGGQILRGFGLFGGSNGYWRFDVLDQIRMDKSMLTEDIDSAMRALRWGAKVVYDRDVVSKEEAPPSAMDLFKQRLRWAQGWTEVTLRHAFPMVFGSPLGCCCCALSTRAKRMSWLGRFRLTIQQRIGVFFLLIWREMFHYISAQVMPAGIASLVTCETDTCRETSLIALTIVLFLFPIINSIMSYALRGPIHKHDIKPYHYLIYALISPGYEWIKYHISVLGHARTVFRLTKWRVTKRHAPRSS